MSIRKMDHIKRKLSSKRVFLVLLSIVVIFSSGIFFDNNAEADVMLRGPNLKQAGPVNNSNGFPLWYKDSNDLKLELCLDGNNALCGFAAPLDFNPAQPISFPDNYPGEAFYQLAEATIDAGGVSAIGVFALEATFNGELPKIGDQTVFGRVRLRIDGLQANREYTITHPYGIDKITTDGEGEINFTEDIGAGGGFDAALNSRIGTFLKWDKDAPAGYMGDPNVPHTITGGVNNQNFFRIEGPGIGLIETKEFSLMGKIAVNDGLDIQQATYSQTAEGGAIDVFVSSEVDQNITVSGTGIETTTLAGGNGQYYTHVAYTGAEPPGEITLTNVDDEPDTIKIIKPVDQITATANYDTTAKTLTVTAKSSDEVGPPTLNVTGYENIPADGTLAISNLEYIPPTITITSANKGTVTIPVNINSIPLTPPTPVVAVAGTDQSVTAGTQAQITLDGSNSNGPIETYSWTQLSGPSVTLTDADKVTATFATPTTPGVYKFQLTVTGPNGAAASTVTINILEPGTTPDPDPTPDPAPTAHAGPDQKDVKQGTLVTLDGSSSQNATSYSWNQVSGPTVVLTSANTAKPTFTFPKQPDSLTFELTATGPSGTAKDTVVISTVPDNLSVTDAEYRTRDRSWRIDGTSDVFGPGVKVTITIVDSANPNGLQLGTADVDALGNWRLQTTGPAIRSGGTLTIESSSGGKLTSVPVRIRAR